MTEFSRLSRHKGCSMRLAIFGTGGMGRELADIARRDPQIAIVFVSDAPAGAVDGIEVISPTDLRPTDRLVLGIGSSSDRETLAQRLNGYTFWSIVSDQAVVSPSASLGAGAVVSDFVVINHSVVIGRHFQANTFVQVSHDCIIGDYVTLSPRVSCNGWVEIEDGVFVGAGAIIRNGSPDRRLRIGRRAIVGMGAVVVEDVEPGTTVIGVPAKPLVRG